MTKKHDSKKIIRNTIIQLAMYATLIFALIITAVSAASPQAAISVKATLMNQDPDPAIVGDIVELRIGVQNTGSESLNDVMIEMDPEYPFTVLEGNDAVQEVGALQAYGYGSDALKTIKYKLKVNKDTPAGYYDVNFWIYEKNSGIRVQQTLSVEVKGRETAQIIHIDKTVLVPGQQTKIKFSVNNVGNALLKDLTFSWENADGIILPVGSDNTRYIPYIDIGDSADMEYDVIADSNANPGLYKLNLYLTYRDSANNSQTKISTIAGVYVGGETDFDVSFSESSAGQISFTVANVGSNPANSVSVIIPQQKSWRVSGSNSVIVGNLNKGDYTVASFKLSSASARVNSTGTGTGSTGLAGSGMQGQMQRPSMMNNTNMSMQQDNNVLVQIAYTDTRGERQIIEKHVPLSLQSLSSDGSAVMMTRNAAAAKSSGWSKYKWPAVIIAVLIIGYYAYRRYKKNNSIKEMFAKKKK